MAYIKKQVTVEKWVSDGEPMGIESQILQLIIEHSDNPLRPTEMLELLCVDHVPPFKDQEVRNALGRLLDSGEIIFTSDRHFMLTTLSD